MQHIPLMAFFISNFFITLQIYGAAAGKDFTAMHGSKDSPHALITFMHPLSPMSLPLSPDDFQETLTLRARLHDLVSHVAQGRVDEDAIAKKKELDALAHLPIVSRLNEILKEDKRYQAWCDHRENCSHKPVEENHQQLWHDAQTRFDIAAENHVPLRYTGTVQPAQERKAIIYAHALYINQGKFSDLSGVRLKYHFNHEAAHLKNKHVLLKLLNQCSCLKRGQEVFQEREPSTPDFLGELYEHDADTQACYAMQCFRCVEALAEPLIGPEDHEGYLGKTNVLKIAYTLKSSDRLCDWHSGD